MQHITEADEPREGDDMEKIKLEAFTIERTTIDTTDREFRDAVSGDYLGDYYDTHLSDMDGETVIIDPDTDEAINPYGRETDLLKLVRPILAYVPTWQIDMYAAERRGEDE